MTEAIAASSLPEDPAFMPLLLGYFPKPLQQRFPELIARHQLRRELVATALANAVVNRLGCAGLARLVAAADPVRAARAAWLAAEAYGLPQAADAADASTAPPAARLDLLLALRRLQEDAALALLDDAEAGLEASLAALRPGIAALLAGAAAAPQAATWRAAGLPEEAVALAAAAPRLAAAPIILRLAAATGTAAEEAAAAWGAVGEAFHIEALRQAALAAPAPGSFGPRVRAALLEDLGAAQARLAAARLRGAAPPAGGFARWRRRRCWPATSPPSASRCGDCAHSDERRPGPWHGRAAGGAARCAASRPARGVLRHRRGDPLRPDRRLLRRAGQPLADPGGTRPHPSAAAAGAIPGGREAWDRLHRSGQSPMGWTRG
ncbi:hypothetical protein ACFQU2_23730 [Siccirubricoccus deserti]